MCVWVLCISHINTHRSVTLTIVAHAVTGRSCDDEKQMANGFST